MTTEPQAEADATPPEQDGWEWAAVEVMGHRSHAGRIREEERFGAKMLRIDVPKFRDATGETVSGDTPLRWETFLYSPAAIFSLRYSDEASVLKANKPYAPPYTLSLAYRDPDETAADLKDEEF